MGGDGHGSRFPYPKNVWTSSGGWWNNPVNWKRNTAIVALGIGAISLYLVKVSNEKAVSI